jgi:hypothetical protein
MKLLSIASPGVLKSDTAAVCGFITTSVVRSETADGITEGGEAKSGKPGATFIAKKDVIFPIVLGTIGNMALN